MRINVHAGHNPDGKIACGAIGIIKESTEARKVVKELKRILRERGHTVYDCTTNIGTSQRNVLERIVKKCNAHPVDIDVSIHFNSGANDRKGNGKTTGCEVLVYSLKSQSFKYAVSVCRSIESLGLKDRGVKERRDLYVLRHTNAPAMLVECCFVDDKDDVKRYTAKKMAKAIADGIELKK